MVSQMTRRVLSEMFGGVGVTTVCGQTDCSAHSLFFLLLCSPCQLSVTSLQWPPRVQVKRIPITHQVRWLIPKSDVLCV